MSRAVVWRLAIGASAVTWLAVLSVLYYWGF